MAEGELSKQWFKLGFRLRLSSTYHLERRRFFEDWNRLTQFLAIVLGSGACVALVGKGTELAIWMTFGVTVLSAANLVIGFGRRGWDHARLHDQFVDLENAHRRATCSQDTYNDLMERKRNLDKAEPVPMPYLITRCQIDLMRADGYEVDRRPKLHWAKRLFANYLPDIDGIFGRAHK
jgi:hypothetical protein